MSNKNDRTNVIPLIRVFRFKHDGLSYITSLPFFKITEFMGDRALVSFDVALNGDFSNDYEIGQFCSEMLIKALHDDKEQICSPIRDIVVSLLEREEGLKGLYGFVTGFFCCIDYWLRCSAIDRGHELDDRSYEQIFAKLQAKQNQQA